MAGGLFRRIMGWLTLKRAIIILFGGAVGVLLIGFVAYETLETVDSTTFCTQVCHNVHYPEAVTFQASPHSEVPCSRCHVGVGTENFVRSKVHGLQDILPNLTGTYERPISTPLAGRRPSSETCEKCHSPQKFSGDLVRTRSVYQSDETNTKKTNTVVLKVGGGNSNIAEGIHWHVTSDVWYLPMDEEHLEIGWVGVEQDEGYKMYINPNFAGEVTSERIATEKKLMDCIDCHNRVSHLFRSPDELLDSALSDSSIDDSLPFVKREAMKVIGTPSPNLKKAYAKAEGFEDFYRQNYPLVYEGKKVSIAQAIDKLKEIIRLTFFPEMLVDWTTHADQSSHNKPSDELMDEWNVEFNDWQTNKSEGCFRCHSTLTPIEDVSSTGVVVSNGVSDNSQLISLLPKNELTQKNVLDASCNLCHYTLSESTSPVPSSIPHPTEKLEDCLLCHNSFSIKPVPEDHPWSTNEACTTCHQAALTDSLLQTKTRVGLASNTPHPIERLEDCLLCHDQSAPLPLGSDHVWSTSETCVACHRQDTILLPAPSAGVVESSVPLLVHPTRGLEDCLLCHDKSAPRSFSSSHPWSTNDTCSTCHKTAPASLPVPAALPLTSVPKISHLTRGLENCLLCHDKSATVPFNTNHPWSTNETCNACHETASNLALLPSSPYRMPDLIPHTTNGLSQCRLCHNQSGVRPYPADHTVIPDNFCTLCHREAPGGPPPGLPPTNAPSILHTLEGRQDCLSCHELPGFKPVLPADHADRTNDMCTSCHNPAN